MGGDVIVVDAGGTKTLLGALRGGVPTSAFDVFDSRRLASGGEPAFLALAAAVRKFCIEHKLAIGTLVVGVPGMLDERRERVSHCNNIRAFEGTELLRGLRAELRVPVLLEQDIMLQLLGEHRCGVARGVDSAFGVYFGTGIGSAWLQGGNPFVPRSACQQAGHIPVGTEGLVCRCGKRDCIEAYASGHTLEALSREHGVPIPELFEQQENAILKAALHRFVTWQGFLLATIATLLEPEMIVVGGGIPDMPGYPRQRLVDTVATQLQSSCAFDVERLRFATLGERAPAFGAQALVDIVAASTSAAVPDSS